MIDSPSRLSWVGQGAMPKRSKQMPDRDGPPIISTVTSIPSTPLKGSRWQLVSASVMLALWIVVLAAIAFYSS
jgi:hypothetical protein